ncbi:MAG: hypothetical protein JNK48_13380 [Bryobacterales bacterium]|nr:hypothetical protein [Bryobacterales bacterium]
MKLAIAALALFSGTLPAAEPSLDTAFDRMYRHQFDAAKQITAEFVSQHPSDPLGHTMRAAAYLFAELDRLQILESEFFNDDKRIADKRQVKADPAVREAVYQNLAKARELGHAALGANPQDKNALFAICISYGIQTDYMALVEKKQFRSLSAARESHGWALKLLKLDPAYYDAYLTTGLSEYLLGSVPFFVRWVLRFEETKGSKSVAVANLEKVARQGRYFRPFAKVLLAVVHLREKRPLQAEMQLTELHREFPENPLFKKEMEKLARRRTLTR